MSQASEVELLMLELINQERTSRGLDPLTINNDLNSAAEDHSAWMLDANRFSHTGENGSSATQRIEEGGYDLEGSWRTAENIGWQSERGEPGIEDDVRDIHESLMNSSGHRANILNPDLEDIGIGVELGDFSVSGSTYDAVMITQNFGRTDAEMNEVAPAPLPETDAPEDETSPVEPSTQAEDDLIAEAESDDDPVTTDNAQAEDDPVDDVEMEDAVTVKTGSVTNTVTSTSIGQDGGPPITATTEETVRTEMTSMLDDLMDIFEFDNLPELEPNGDDATIVTSFEGSIDTPDGTFTTEDQAEFDNMLADLLADFGTGFCGVDMDFG